MSGKNNPLKRLKRVKGLYRATFGCQPPKASGFYALIYKVEPYVVAANVYSVAPHIGRGGWTWYTGSASWMYRLGIEAILGLKRKGRRLQIDPCIPDGWGEYELTYRDGETQYHIHVVIRKGSIEA